MFPHALALAMAPEFGLLLGVSPPPLPSLEAGFSLPSPLGGFSAGGLKGASVGGLKGDGRSSCGEGGSISGASYTGGALFFL